MKRLGILFIGLNGSVANTTIIGTIKSINEGHPQLGLLTDNTNIFKNKHLISLENLVFGGWDINNRNAYESGIHNRVLDLSIINEYASNLTEIKPYAGLISNYDSNILEANNIKQCSSHLKAIELLIDDINNFKHINKLDKVVLFNLGSPIKCNKFQMEMRSIHDLYTELKNFKSHKISSAILYYIASLKTNSPFVDYSANTTLQIPSLIELSKSEKVPIAGKDGSTGQTLLKTIIARMLKLRNFKLTGWYSTNILGNLDGKILCEPGHGEAKMEDKLGVLEPILGYNDYEHVVNISYYKPRNDNKESWDNIDFCGWLNLPMNLKINWLGRDSILAAPAVIDLCRLIEYAHRIGEFGLQTQLSLFFKHPLGVTIKDFFSFYENFEEYYINIMEE